MQWNRTAPLASLPSEPAAADDLINFLNELTQFRMRRGVRFPQWWMLLVAMLAILNNESLHPTRLLGGLHHETNLPHN